MQAIRSTRPGGHVGFVGIPHDVELPGEEMFYSHLHLHGGPAPVRRFLPHLVDLIWNREIDPGMVFDLAVPLEEVAEGYRAMDERRAIKALLWPRHEEHLTRPPVEALTSGSGPTAWFRRAAPVSHPHAVLTSPSTLGDAWRVC